MTDPKKYSIDSVSTSLVLAKSRGVVESLMRDVETVCHVRHQLPHGPVAVRVETTADGVRIVVEQAMREMTTAEVDAMIKLKLSQEAELRAKNTKIDDLTRERDRLQAEVSSNTGSC